MKASVPTALSGRALSMIGGTARISSVLGPFIGGLLATTTNIRVALGFQVS